MFKMPADGSVHESGPNTADGVADLRRDLYPVLFGNFFQPLLGNQTNIRVGVFQSDIDDDRRQKEKSDGHDVRATISGKLLLRIIWHLPVRFSCNIDRFLFWDVEKDLDQNRGFTCISVSPVLVVAAETGGQARTAVVIWRPCGPLQAIRSRSPGSGRSTH